MGTAAEAHPACASSGASQPVEIDLLRFSGLPAGLLLPLAVCSLAIESPLQDNEQVLVSSEYKFGFKSCASGTGRLDAKQSMPGIYSIRPHRSSEDCSLSRLVDKQSIIRSGRDLGAQPTCNRFLQDG